MAHFFSRRCGQISSVFIPSAPRGRPLRLKFYRPVERTSCVSLHTSAFPSYCCMREKTLFDENEIGTLVNMCRRCCFVLTSLEANPFLVRCCDTLHARTHRHLLCAHTVTRKGIGSPNPTARFTTVIDVRRAHPATEEHAK